MILSDDSRLLLGLEWPVQNTLMSLIENLEREGWQPFLQNSFRRALELLSEDRVQWAGSSIDDLKSWLTMGGIDRVRYHLNRQMQMRQFSPQRTKAINECLKHLIQAHRHQLLQLASTSTITMSSEDCLEVLGLTKVQFEELLNQVRAGENPFEQWMKAQGHSDAEIAAAYHYVDTCLLNPSLAATTHSAADLN